MANYNSQYTGEQIDAAIGTVLSGDVGGLSDDAKFALLQCFQNVAWANENGHTYYDALNNALYPPADLLSIQATYTQSGTVFSLDPLDSLRSDLVVKGRYSDNSLRTITEYTLSGTLVTGQTCTITATYESFTATFDVVVSSTVPTEIFTTGRTLHQTGGTITDSDGVYTFTPTSDLFLDDDWTLYAYIDGTSNRVKVNTVYGHTIRVVYDVTLTGSGNNIKSTFKLYISSSSGVTGQTRYKDFTLNGVGHFGGSVDIVVSNDGMPSGTGTVDNDTKNLGYQIYVVGDVGYTATIEAHYYDLGVIT